MGRLLKRVELGQRLVDGRNLPLLPAEVGVAHNSFLVDDEKTGALSKRDHRALHVVLTEDRPVRVGEAGERNVVRIEEVAGVLKRVRSYRENLNAALLELLVPVPQLREMPAAERSHEAAQKHQHDRLPAQFR